jgi:hypothetical protein
LIASLLQISTLALGVAASPLPIVAVLVLLLTKRARFSSLVLLASWVIGVVIALAIAVVFAGTLRMPRAGTDLMGEGVFTLLLGIGLVTMGVISRRGRVRQEDPQATPSWVNSVDNLSPIGGAVVVFLNATTSPKNLALAITAGRMIANTGAPLAEEAVWVLLYVAIASLTIAAPVALYFFGGNTSIAILERWKRVVTTHAAAVMEITLFVLGLGMTARGLYNLLS